MTTPWIAALQLPKADSALAKLVRIEPKPLVGLYDMRPRMAVEQLTVAFKNFYEPSANDLRLIREVVDIMGSHASTYYSSKHDFTVGAKGKPRLAIDPPVIMFSGPTGAGTSMLILALARLFANISPVLVDPDLPEFPIRPIAAVQVESNVSGAKILTSIATSLGLGQHYAKGTKWDTAHLRLRLFQLACCCVFPDELQFVSRSSNSNALAAKLLTLLSELGVPVFYACNYSLGHKLKKRPPEDRARLLSAPMIMLPDVPDSPDFIRFLEDAKVIFNGVLAIKPASDAAEIHSMSFGLRRMVVRLLAFGHRIAREAHRGECDSFVVTMDHIRAAYLSTDFEQDRVTVEGSFAALLGIGEANNDYICPFDLAPSEEAVLRKIADARRQDALNAAESVKSRTREERETVKRAEKSSAGFKGSVPTKPAKPARLASPRTAAELLAGL